jgi:hypothetical protein
MKALLLLAGLAAAPILAQSPKITQQGDPSIRPPMPR